jgi:hypothetical protein
MSQFCTKQDMIICGLAAQRINIVSRAPAWASVVLPDDPLMGSWMPQLEPLSTVEFEFWVRDPVALEVLQTRFPVGSGAFATHELGAADVCQFCGTAWLPGTWQCPACGGSTNHHERALEYAARNTGRIIGTETITGVVLPTKFTARVEFHTLSWTVGGVSTMFRHSLWHHNLALWVCSFCGHMVNGYQATCPGCGGNRQAVKALATQARECLWCGKQTVGGYACPSCNMRLKAAR